MSRLVWMLMLAGSLITSGCERKPADRAPGKVTSEDVRRDAGQAMNTAVEFSQKAKEDFQKNLDARLKNMDAEIAKLHEKGHDLKGDAKVKWDQKLADLETKKDAARANWPRSLNRAAQCGRMSSREPSQPGTTWTKPSRMPRTSSDRASVTRRTSRKRSRHHEWQDRCSERPD